MIIGALEKNSFIDFPGRLSAVLFTAGCNFRCPYCHNPEIVDWGSSGRKPVPLDSVISYLRERSGFLDGVVITGGEPCLHGEHLLALCRRIREMGYPLKLDTNGSRPDVLKSILSENLADYLAMDIKTTPAAYHRVWPGADGSAIKTSAAMIMDAGRKSGICYEFRTTCVRPIIDETAFDLVLDWIDGAARYVLQGCRPDVALDPFFFDNQQAIVTPAELAAWKKKAEGRVGECCIR
ncbi:MAG: anaerobic ribonucleoside-triphosphate reductase activating protein [Desulfobacterales bacterium]|nr:MAG: anaerobic ribonucleoside-triphosphate reductase activating protein [Desulfobacterales bacterium]